MKNKYMNIFAIVLFCLFIGYNVCQSRKVDSVSNLLLANIEALADNQESGVSCSASVDCGNGTVSCTGVQGCVSYATHVKCCDANGNDYYSYCAC